MSKLKFTPGPWRSAPYFPQEWLNNGQKEQGYEVTYGEDKEVVSERIYTKEDAALIAAAPEMYEMLERIQDYMTGGPILAKKPSVEEIAHLLEKARGER